MDKKAHRKIYLRLLRKQYQNICIDTKRISQRLPRHFTTSCYRSAINEEGRGKREEGRGKNNAQPIALFIRRGVIHHTPTNCELQLHRAANCELKIVNCELQIHRASQLYIINYKLSIA